MKDNDRTEQGQKLLAISIALGIVEDLGNGKVGLLNGVKKEEVEEVLKERVEEILNSIDERVQAAGGPGNVMLSALEIAVLDAIGLNKRKE